MNKLNINARKELVQQITALGPWHQNIQLTDDLGIGEVFADGGKIIDRERNGGISLIAQRDSFLKAIDSIYPESLKQKTLLDCACNAGGFCFWARERDVHFATGFEVREHWLKQATFVQDNRTVAPTDRIQFIQEDLYNIPERRMKPFSITTFTGLLDHLPDPVSGLKIAADLTSEVLILNSFTTWGEDDGYFKIGVEPDNHLMCGIYELKWLPTGPQVLAKLLNWMGFGKTKLRQHHQSRFDPRFGVAEIFASRHENLLDDLDGEYI